MTTYANEETWRCAMLIHTIWIRRSIYELCAVIAALSLGFSLSSWSIYIPAAFSVLIAIGVGISFYRDTKAISDLQEMFARSAELPPDRF